MPQILSRPLGVLSWRRRILVVPLALMLVGAGVPLPPDQETEHWVKPGETLGGVAVRAKVPRVLIIEANGLQPPYGLRAGQKLKIPRTRQHTVIRGETGFTIAYTYGVAWREIAVANGLEPDAALKPGQKLLIPTVLAMPQKVMPRPATPTPTPAAAVPAPKPMASGTISGSSAPIVSVNPTATMPRFAWPLAPTTVRRGFSPRSGANFHDGVDLFAPVGNVVRASAAGRVIFAGNEPRQFGNLVVIDHGGGWQSAYAFLSRVTVKEGDEVASGERIGLSGRTGLARGPELHFEIRQDNRAVDPLERLPRRDAARD